MALMLAGVLFAVFVVNVVLGATGGTAFLGDIGEMLTLFAATLAFVAGKVEYKRRSEVKCNGEEGSFTRGGPSSFWVMIEENKEDQ